MSCSLSISFINYIDVVYGFVLTVRNSHTSGQHKNRSLSTLTISSGVCTWVVVVEELPVLLVCWAFLLDNLSPHYIHLVRLGFCRSLIAGHRSSDADSFNGIQRGQA